MKSLTASALVLVDVAEIGTAKPSVRMFPILESSLGLRCKQPNPSYVAGSDSLSAIALTRTSRKLLFDNALRLSVELRSLAMRSGMTGYLLRMAKATFWREGKPTGYFL